MKVSVSETVITIFLISLTFGDQKYVPFRVLSQMQIYEFSVSANMFFEDISVFLCRCLIKKSRYLKVFSGYYY